MFDYGDVKSVADLNCKCYICMKDIKPQQWWRYLENHYAIEMSCCGRIENITLTEEQIKKNNESGVYYAFMGANNYVRKP
jgi:hypothetical protein